MSSTLATDELLILDSLLLGRLEIRSSTVFSFPAGLPGFVTLRRFALVETQRDDLVWLQSLDDAALTFLLGDPFLLVPGFEVDLPASDLAALGASLSPNALLVLVVVLIEAGEPRAANLQSPIVLDRERRVGRQVVMPESKYGMQHPITIG